MLTIIELCALQAVYQPQGGILASELCIAAHIQAAQSHGAEFHSGEKVESWEVDPSSGTVTVYTDRGQYTASKLVLTAGASMPDIMPELQVTCPVAPLSFCLEGSLCGALVVLPWKGACALCLCSVSSSFSNTPKGTVFCVFLSALCSLPFFSTPCIVGGATEPPTGNLPFQCSWCTSLEPAICHFV